MEHYGFLPVYLLLVVCSFIGVELYWWVGDIEKFPSTIDYFIDTLEEAFEELSRVVMQDRSTSQKNRSRTPFQPADQTFNSSDTHVDITLISAESEVSLTRSDVLELYHDQNIERRFQYFESFVLRMAKTQELVKTIFARRVLRFFNLLVIETVTYLVFLAPSHQLDEFNCLLPESYRAVINGSTHYQVIPAMFTGVTQRTG